VWRLYQEVGRSDRDLGLELLAFLNDWLIEHILGEDKKISAYANGT
jgi:hemerythrin